MIGQEDRGGMGERGDSYLVDHGIVSIRMSVITFLMPSYYVFSWKDLLKSTRLIKKP